jgi:hypothetical protein
MADLHLSNTRSQGGFSYAEILLSVALLMIMLVPAVEALQSGIAGGQNPALAARQLALRDRMEQVLARPFAELYAQTYLPGGNTPGSVSASLSDPAGAPDRRNVVLYRYNATTGTLSSGDTGLVFASVYYDSEGSTKGLNTLVGRWW